jgi:prefoldin subunit 5
MNKLLEERVNHLQEKVYIMDEKIHMLTEMISLLRQNIDTMSAMSKVNAPPAYVPIREPAELSLPVVEDEHVYSSSMPPRRSRCAI